MPYSAAVSRSAETRPSSSSAGCQRYACQRQLQRNARETVWQPEQDAKDPDGGQPQREQERGGNKEPELLAHGALGAQHLLRSLRKRLPPVVAQNAAIELLAQGSGVNCGRESGRALR